MKHVILAFGSLMGLLPAAFAAEPFAVVELFASEGCSSCPPADHLLRKVTAEAQAQGKNIVTLSFEVDYWDRLGWKDPFSKPEFTQRQYQYANILNTSRVYTPQMMINGQHAFVGSDEAKARQFIEEALKTQGQEELTVRIKDKDSAKIVVEYHVTHADHTKVLNLALVLNDAQSHPNAGENAGRVLQHSHIVQVFKTVDLNAAQGEVTLDWTQSLDPRRLIAYVQNKQDMHIVAVDQVSL